MAALLGKGGCLCVLLGGVGGGGGAAGWAAAGPGGGSGLAAGPAREAVGRWLACSFWLLGLGLGLATWG